MNRTLASIMLACILLPSCNPVPPIATSEQITVQFTAASTPWLAGLYKCAGTNGVNAEQRAADFLDSGSVDMVIRIGQPSHLTIPAFQIGTEDILILVNPKNPVYDLTADQVRGLFTGQIQNWKAINGTDTPVEVWVFPMEEDVQQIFEQSILGGSPVTSQAHLANNPNELSQAVSKDVNAIGILTRRWKTDNTSNVFTAASNLPVLAITQSEPQGTLAQILACLQK